MEKKLSWKETYNVFLVDPENREIQHKLADVFKRAGNSLGLDTSGIYSNSPSGAVPFTPKEDMPYTDMQEVLERVSKTLQTAVAVSTSETLEGDEIKFASLQDDEQNNELRKKSQELAMGQCNLLILVYH